MNKTLQIGFLLLGDFSMTCFSATLDALRQANRLAGQPLYKWIICGIDSDPVRSSANVAIQADCSLHELAPPDILMVVASATSRNPGEEALYARLRYFAARGVVLGGLSLGSYILARAGLLEGRRCTVHWENLDAFREAFPDLDVTGDLFEIDGDRITCAGGTAGMDLMLHYIARDHGPRFARDVADVFMHQRIRERNENQRMPLRVRIGVSHPKLLRYIELVEKNTDLSLSQQDLARRVGLSSRQLERLFQKYLSTTPSRYYMEHRLKRARGLLRDTTLNIIDVAVACGFSSHSHFTKSYREHFGLTPRDERVEQVSPHST